MKAIKGVYENGRVNLLHSPGIKGQQDILVIFPDDVESQEESLQKREKLLNYFMQRRKKTKPLEYSVKDLVEEGK